MFQLYKNEETVFTFDDYGALLNETKQIGASKVLEFGPGNSTLAFVEAGCLDITTLEHEQNWFKRANLKLRQFRCVHLERYTNTEQIVLPPDLERKRFDLIFVDSPAGTSNAIGREGLSRLNTVLWSLAHAPIVLLHDAKRPGEQKTLARIAPQVSKIEMINTIKGMARIMPA